MTRRAAAALEENAARSKALAWAVVAAAGSGGCWLSNTFGGFAALWLAGLLVFGLVLWLVPKAQRPTPSDVEVFKAENEARKTLAEIFGGCLLLVGAYHAWVQIQDTRHGQDENIRLAEQGQITDRFTKAVEQLGNAKLEVRLGGIYALEQIARASKRDHWPIMELLTTCVRETAPWRSASRATDVPQGGAVQAMLTVIGRREVQREQPTRPGSKPRRWNLSRTDLRGQDLTKAELAWFDISRAHLEGANLAQAHLDRSDLSDADLAGASLGAASLLWANLSGANLQCTDLSGADMRNARAPGADFRGALFMDSTQLDGANLEAADLRRASFGVAKWSTIESLKLANIHGIRDALPGFVEWARQAGAVQCETDSEWAALLKANGKGVRTIRRQTSCPSEKSESASLQASAARRRAVADSGSNPGCKLSQAQ